MKLAIDSYCYHRQFGEIYPRLETDPGKRITMAEFVRRAHGFGVQGVSLESCFMPEADIGTRATAREAALDVLREQLDELGLERVWAWGHPDGLSSGADALAVNNLIHHLGVAKRLGAKVMRICCGSRRTRPNQWLQHRVNLLPLLRHSVAAAEAHGIVLAIENHIDLLADELVEILETLNSPWLGVCLDTANNLRMLEDPLDVAAKLVRWTRATHIKDVAANTVTKHSNPRDFAFWPSVPVGQGVIDMPSILAMLVRAGYQGLLALELDYLHAHYEVDDDVEIAIMQSLATLQYQRDQAMQVRRA